MVGLGVNKLGSSVGGVLFTKLVYAEVWVREMVPDSSFVSRESVFKALREALSEEQIISLCASQAFFRSLFLHCLFLGCLPAWGSTVHLGFYISHSF